MFVYAILMGRINYPLFISQIYYENIKTRIYQRLLIGPDHKNIKFQPQLLIFYKFDWKFISYNIFYICIKKALEVVRGKKLSLRCFYLYFW